MKIILHSNDCPRCKVLETKLKDKGINYKKNNDMNILINLGFMSAPVLQIDDKFMDFSEAIKYVNEVQVNG
jgi:glutaredoxin